MYIHLNFVIHRDLKLENILISKLSENKIEVKIIDFGSAVYYNPLDMRTEVVGTPINYPPEII